MWKIVQTEKSTYLQNRAWKLGKDERVSSGHKKFSRDYWDSLNFISMKMWEPERFWGQGQWKQCHFRKVVLAIQKDKTKKNKGPECD